MGTLSGCGISGLDGDYWITQQDGNEIWVEKNNGWALVFTNDATWAPEFCRSLGPPSPTPPTTSSPTKSPMKNPTAQPTNPQGPTVQPTPKPTNQPTTHKPTSQPTTPLPTRSPTPKPTSGGTECCTDRNLGYQTCTTNAWCGANASQCTTCGGVIMSVPLKRTGCCSWGGGDCSGRIRAATWLVNTCSLIVRECVMELGSHFRTDETCCSRALLSSILMIR